MPRHLSSPSVCCLNLSISVAISERSRRNRHPFDAGPVVQEKKATDHLAATQP